MVPWRPVPGRRGSCGGLGCRPAVPCRGLLSVPGHKSGDFPAADARDRPVDRDWPPGR